ncbi:MAG: hypothetical protein A3F84_10245 [Candidatus Handelsmanbacteria bacterium RIFCSPLOWO2_12_FULL_64_10]|uniref:Protein SirB1 N-terminal domain-containing protein n=1 Tax=Handelsmanbacteria sp. (strain RIFCSPLOWO2_12_FULL_64_10) TaxID=1817868 RepID=A0A1F6D4I3_HANXR|nr:MAG: hypothetical protein A3F84_10245 [Candidatus Handelsmanbacteria bacterium RIFCSPLOWO2_12_FULL_64_10]
MKPLTYRDVQAILSLLTDDDKALVRAVQERLFARGREAVARVRAAASNPQALRAAEVLLRRLEEPPIEAQFEGLSGALDGDVDLEEGAFVIARFGCPWVDVEGCAELLDRMAADVAPRVSAGDHPIHAIRTLNAYLAEEQGFRGGDVSDPDNSFMDRVLERKVGIPITLSAVYLFIGKRLRLPLCGVGMPGRFIVKYEEGDQEIFFDPFYGGRVITKNECREIVTRMGFTFEEGHLARTPSRHILIRMMHNLLQHVYLPGGEEERARRLIEYIQILQGV